MASLMSCVVIGFTKRIARSADCLCEQRVWPGNGFLRELVLMVASTDDLMPSSWMIPGMSNERLLSQQCSENTSSNTRSVAP